MNKLQLQSLLKKYRTPRHIIDHMRKVAAVGLFFAKKMNESGVKVNEELVEYGSLLHDIVKIVDFPDIDESKLLDLATPEDKKYWKELIVRYHRDKHCVAGYKVLLVENEEELALIVKKHGYNNLIAVDFNDRPVTLEEKIVYYADKRVRHDQVVSLKERIEDGQKRYFPDGNLPADNIKVWSAILELEKELCEKAKVQPKNITEKSIANFVPKGF